MEKKCVDCERLEDKLSRTHAECEERLQSAWSVAEHLAQERDNLRELLQKAQFERDSKEAHIQALCKIINEREASPSSPTLYMSDMRCETQRRD